jgi:SpoVK/Ycf46/Vps4 family AAA+-type ATPase
MNQPKLVRWTRSGILEFSWSPFESLEKLVLPAALRERLIARAEALAMGEAHYHELRLPWRYGIFLYGPSGTGKTAASKGLALQLNWRHITLPAHEILDSHLFEKALFDAISEEHAVIVLEDIDVILRRMEPEVFFTLLDHAMERAEGSLWVATSRHAETIPKTQLLRPGRFDESIRMDLPQVDLRKEILTQVLGVSDEILDPPPEGVMNLPTWLEMTAGLSYSHFEELRQLTARLRMEKRLAEDIQFEMKSFVEDQLIAGDRLGGLSDETARVEERVRQVDPRILMAALQMTDVFRTLIEKVVGAAANQDSGGVEEVL